MDYPKSELNIIFHLTQHQKYDKLIKNMNTFKLVREIRKECVKNGIPMPSCPRKAFFNAIL